MKHPLSLFIIALMTATTVVMGAAILSNPSLAQAPMILDPERVAVEVYDKLPDFPRENQYLHRKKKQVATENTLASRLIRYHMYSQSRSPQYRLDWKITLADYLGINGYMQPENYPGASFLKSNPIERDQVLIRSLSRAERNALIQTIVDIVDPGKTTSLQPSSFSTSPSASPKPEIVTPSEKATDLLMPASPPQDFDSDQPTGAARFLLPNETP